MVEFRSEGVMFSFSPSHGRRPRMGTKERMERRQESIAVGAVRPQAAPKVIVIIT
jgi:hypothetical protein